MNEQRFTHRANDVNADAHIALGDSFFLSENDPVN